jgi:hypothetical protein
MHWDSLCGCDFFSVEAIGIIGTIRSMVFFVIVAKTRAVEIAGIATHLDGHRHSQVRPPDSRRGGPACALPSGRPFVAGLVGAPKARR